jgi:uncharacterized phiE125 gp8 family phage protein
MSKLVLDTAPTELPVTVEQLREHLHLTTTDEDGYLQRLLAAATAEAEADTWSRFVEQVWLQFLDAFSGDPIRLPYPPVQSIDEVTYVDPGGNPVTLAETVYELGSENGVGVMRLKYGQTWPATRGASDDVSIEFTCGYGAAGDVPEPIKQAILLSAEAMWRGAEVAPAYRALLAGYDWRTSQ